MSTYGCIEEDAEYTTVYDYLPDIYPCGHQWDGGDLCSECLYDLAIDRGEL